MDSINCQIIIGLKILNVEENKVYYNFMSNLHKISHYKVTSRSNNTLYIDVNTCIFHFIGMKCLGNSEYIL